MNLKERLRKKLKKNGGFTLIEMLIVVAIIAILVIVSIPMVSSSLDKARKSTDDANVRAAEAAALISYMTTDPVPDSATYYYNENGTTTTGTAPSSKDGYSYGQGGYDDAPENCEGGYVVVTITDGEAVSSWAKVS